MVYACTKELDPQATHIPNELSYNVFCTHSIWALWYQRQVPVHGSVTMIHIMWDVTTYPCLWRLSLSLYIYIYISLSRSPSLSLSIYIYMCVYKDAEHDTEVDCLCQLTQYGGHIDNDSASSALVSAHVRGGHFRRLLQRELQMRYTNLRPRLDILYTLLSKVSFILKWVALRPSDAYMRQ